MCSFTRRWIIWMPINHKSPMTDPQSSHVSQPSAPHTNLWVMFDFNNFYRHYRITCFARTPNGLKDHKKTTTDAKLKRLQNVYRVFFTSPLCVCLSYELPCSVRLQTHQTSDTSILCQLHNFFLKATGGVNKIWQKSIWCLERFSSHLIRDYDRK